MMMMRVRGRSRRAIVLMIVLWISAVLGMLAYSVIYQTTIETRLSSVRKRMTYSESLARAGIARGMVDLYNDLVADYSPTDDYPQGLPFDSEGDYWSILGADEDDYIDVELREGQGTFNLLIEDEDRYFNLNLLDATSRPLVQEIIEMIGYEEEDAKITASAIIDYADTNDQPMLDSSTGVEGVAYGLLRAENEGRRVREDEVDPVVFPNEPYFTVEQLLDVYGVTPELYFGPGSPEAEHYRREMGLGQAGSRRDSFTIRNRRRNDDEVLGLRDFFTTEATTTLNLNTAPEHVLTALFNAAGRTDGDRLAETVIRDRRGGRRSSAKKDDAYKTLADVYENADLAAIRGAMETMHPISTLSSVFTLTSTGTSGEVRKTYSVTVSRQILQLVRDEGFEEQERRRERERRSNRDRDDSDEREVRRPAIYVLHWNPT